MPSTCRPAVHPALGHRAGDHERARVRRIGALTAWRIEITESVLLAARDDARAALRRGHPDSALDDFGTGYSSLSYLRNYPFDKIKIDRSFVHDLGVREDSLGSCTYVVGLAKALGRRVAEGVETQEQLEQLRALGCTEAQGYLFSPPRPYDEIAAAWAARNCGERAGRRRIRPFARRDLHRVDAIATQEPKHERAADRLAGEQALEVIDALLSRPVDVTIVAVFTPPRAAGESASTDSTRTADSAARPKCRTMRRGSGIV